MNDKVISLSEALDVMNRKDTEGEFYPFDCTVRTFNRYSKTGGDLLKMRQVQLLPLSGREKKTSTDVRDLQRLPGVERNPNHFEFKTRNVKLPSGSIKKINLNFLISVNGVNIIY